MSNLKNKKNNLKEYRNRYSIPLGDSAFILDMDAGNLSKYESGQLSPTFKVAICYHLLYGMPMQLLIDSDFRRLKTELTDRLFILSEDLLKKKRTKSVLQRMDSIDGMITRLSNADGNDKE